MNLRRSRYYIVLLFCIAVLPFSAHAQSKADIVTLQTFLEQKGFLVISPSDTKGNFGPKTKTALIEYQKSVGLPAEGVYGPQTKAKMKGDIVSPAVFPDIQPTASKPTEPSQSFVTETQLQKAIDALKQSLIVKSIGNSSVTPQSNFAAIALSQKIDQLTNTVLTTPVITGGSMTNTNISGGTMSGVSFSGTALFSGGNVGIGTSTPLGMLHVGNYPVVDLYASAGSGTIDGYGQIGSYKFTDTGADYETIS